MPSSSEDVGTEEEHPISPSSGDGIDRTYSGDLGVVNDGEVGVAINNFNKSGTSHLLIINTY